jgi:hypothetical protein
MERMKMNKIKLAVRNAVLGFLLVSSVSTGFAMPTKLIRVPDFVTMFRNTMEYAVMTYNRVDFDYAECVQPLLILGLADLVSEPVCKHNPILKYVKRVAVIGGVVGIVAKNITIK